MAKKKRNTTRGSEPTAPAPAACVCDGAPRDMAFAPSGNLSIFTTDTASKSARPELRLE